MTGTEMTAAPVPLTVSTVLEVPGPVSVTFSAPLWSVPSESRTVTLTVCAPFAGAPSASIKRVPGAVVSTVTLAESETVAPPIEPKAKKPYDLVELGSVSVLVNGVIPDCGEKLVFANSVLLSVTKTPVGLEVTEIVSVSPGAPVVLDGEIVMVLVGVVVVVVVVPGASVPLYSYTTVAVDV